MFFVLFQFIHNFIKQNNSKTSIISGERNMWEADIFGGGEQKLQRNTSIKERFIRNLQLASGSPGPQRRRKINNIRYPKLPTPPLFRQSVLIAQTNPPPQHNNVLMWHLLPRGHSMEIHVNGFNSKNIFLYCE